MGVTKIGDDFIDDSGIIVRRGARKPIHPEYQSFFKEISSYHKPLKEEGLEFDVSNAIGDEGSKELYKNKGIEMRWDYKKKSGEHKKNNGRIIIHHDSLSAYLEVEKGKAIGFTITDSRFASEIREHREMPFYSEIAKFFGWK